MNDIKDIKNDTKGSMEKTIHYLNSFFKTIRTGRASISLLDHIQVLYHDQLLSLNQLGTLNAPDFKSIHIIPWDKASISLIEKAILKSSLNITPINDGNKIILNIPIPTEERRMDLVKQIKDKANEMKNTIRASRREANDSIKELKKTYSEDMIRTYQNEIQKITDEYIAKIDELVEKKKNDILSL